MNPPSPLFRSPQVARVFASGALGIVSIGVLAACSGQASADASNGTSSTDTSSSSSSSSTGTTSTSYKDGSYTETGDYQTPGGTENVTVTLTLKSGAITAVSLKASETTPNSQHYVSEFESGISAAVVGKKISGLKVGAVSGSSLTSNGFNAALAKIESDAAA